MNICLLDSHQVLPAAWDAFIEESREGNIYATYDYLQHCERSWKAAILKDEQGAWQAVMPIQVARRWGMEYIYQDPFARELGIFTKEELTRAQYQALLDASLGSYRYVPRYCFNVDNGYLLQKVSFRYVTGLKPIATYHLDLRLPYDRIWQNYRRDRRYSIRRAQRYDQHIGEEQQVEDALRIFSQSTYHRIPGLVPYQVPLMEKLYKRLLHMGKLQAYYVTYKDEKIAAALMVRYRQKLIYLFGANTEQAFRLRSSTLLLDHIIRQHAARDLTFDFEGGDVPGLGDFYSSFGAHPRIIYAYSRVPRLLEGLIGLKRVAVKNLTYLYR
jgi:hypothetical protein